MGGFYKRSQGGKYNSLELMYVRMWFLKIILTGLLQGTLLFDGNAKEAFDKATEANGGELKVKGNSVTWQLLEGDEEKEVLKKIIEAQQESHRSKGRGKLENICLYWRVGKDIYILKHFAAQGPEEDPEDEAEEEEADGEEVAETTAEFSLGGQRRNLIVMMKKLVSVLYLEV